MPEALLLLVEVILLATRRHVIILLVPLLLIGLAGWLSLAETCPIAMALQLDSHCPFVVTVGMAVAAVPFVLDWLTTRFVLTNRRVLRLQYPLWLLTRSLELSSIEGLTRRQGILGRLFGFSDFVVDSAATEGGRSVFDSVPAPQVVLGCAAAAVESVRQTRAGVGR